MQMCGRLFLFWHTNIAEDGEPAIIHFIHSTPQINSMKELEDFTWEKVNLFKIERNRLRLYKNCNVMKLYHLK